MYPTSSFEKSCRHTEMLMFYNFPRHLSLILIILVFLFLSGCAGESRFTQTNNPSDSPNTQDSASSEDPDLSLESAEPQSSLEQELAALRQTGMWDGNSSPITKRDLENTHFVFPVVLNNQVQMYLNLFQTKQRKTFSSWLSRSSIYLPLMKKELKNAGLPEELVYLSMIESGYNQRACSSANAVGLWQFMDATGREHNLDINKYVDERRDAEKSTKAAVAFLTELYAEFGDWHLAVAAYNAGPGKIRKGLDKYGVSNFWALAQEDYLALETKRYVPKLIAAMILAKNPEKYGFTDTEYKRPLEYTTLKVPAGLSLDALALVCNTSVKEVKFLNQELREGKTPPNQPHYVAKIPVGTEEIASKNINRLHSVVSTGYKSHKIKRGETLATICDMYGLNKTTLLKVNNLRSSRLSRGQYLRIPYNTVSYQLLPEGSRIAQIQQKNNLVLHKIRSGENITQIAKKYNVSPAMIMTWNNLGSAHKINVGQQLALYPGNRATMTVSETVVASTESEDMPAVASSAKRSTQKSLPVLTATKKKDMRLVQVREPIEAGSLQASQKSKTTVDNQVSATRIKTIAALDVQKSRHKVSSTRQKTITTADGATKKKIINTVAANDRNFKVYKVQNGDTLWTISKKFKTSLVLIKQWTNIKSDVLQPGSQLKLKKV